MREATERERWAGQAALDWSGKKVGTILEVLRDDQTDVVWLVVAIGRFGEPVTLAPATEAFESHEGVTTPLARDAVHPARGAIGETAGRAGSSRSLLYRHYGLTGLPRRRTNPAA